MNVINWSPENIQFISHITNRIKYQEINNRGWQKIGRLKSRSADVLDYFGFSKKFEDLGLT